MRPHRVTAAGQKKGIFGRVRAKAGQSHCSKRFVRQNFFGINVAGASRSDQCYEPCGAEFAIAIAGAEREDLKDLITTS
jgi:hypothetical protein